MPSKRNTKYSKLHNWIVKAHKNLRKMSANVPSATFYLSHTNSIKENNDLILPQYGTWPQEQLHATVQDVIQRKNVFVTATTICDIQREVEAELNEQCPIEIKEQYDFCMICAEVDYRDALAVQVRLSTEYELVGHVIWDSVALGMALFDAFEDVVLRSTKVVFYISDNFNENDFCCYLARNFFVSNCGRDTERKVVPLMTDITTTVPESLQLVDRLVLNNEHQFRFRFPAIFADGVKQEKITRQLKYKKEIDNKRLSIVGHLVQSRLGVFV